VGFTCSGLGFRVGSLAGGARKGALFRLGGRRLFFRSGGARFLLSGF
jgi:hypothetical protein